VYNSEYIMKKNKQTKEDGKSSSMLSIFLSYRALLCISFLNYNIESFTLGPQFCCLILLGFRFNPTMKA
jgi:hypothetical protein